MRAVGGCQRSWGGSGRQECTMRNWPGVSSGAMWLPVWSEWTEKGRASVRDACAGLRAAGVEARIDRLGDGQHCIELLRVHAPFASIELAEDWLLRIVQPYDDADAWW